MEKLNGVNWPVNISLIIIICYNVLTSVCTTIMPADSKDCQSLPQRAHALSKISRKES